MKAEKKRKCLELGFLKKKNYTKKQNLKYLKTNELLIQLKKSLEIIYRYHTNNKKILFIGEKSIKYENIKKKIKLYKHKWIPDLLWKKGGFINHNLIRYDLVVILSKQFNEQIIREVSIVKKPIISFNADLNIFDRKPTYKIPSDFINSSKNFIYSILFAILKRANRVKNRMNNYYKKHKKKNVVFTKKKKNKKFTKDTNKIKTKYS